MRLDNCPDCDASLIGDPIPDKYIARGWYGDSTHWRREVMVEIRGVYDGGLYFVCPDCGFAWPRFAGRTPLAAASAYYAAKANTPEDGAA